MLFLFFSFFFQDGEKTEDRGEARKKQKKEQVNRVLIVLFICRVLSLTCVMQKTSIIGIYFIYQVFFGKILLYDNY